MNFKLIMCSRIRIVVESLFNLINSRIYLQQDIFTRIAAFRKYRFISVMVSHVMLLLMTYRKPPIIACMYFTCTGDNLSPFLLLL